jgi:hypothetical protein
MYRVNPCALTSYFLLYKTVNHKIINLAPRGKPQVRRYTARRGSISAKNQTLGEITAFFFFVTRSLEMRDPKVYQPGHEPASVQR